LLRAIETRTFYRVGGVRKVEVNVRIVAATNRNLDTVINEGSFRADLLYRVNGIQIALAPLRERPDDIEPLAAHLLRQLAGPAHPRLTPEALDALTAYHWPGNVRQLRNCLERAVLLANDSTITVSELPPEVLRPAAAATVGSISQAPAAAALAATDQQYSTSSSGAAPLREVERQQILSALEKTGWHRGKTAEILGISPSTLYRRLRDYNLERRYQGQALRDA
jgi:DNA-binding NtrC family response regulator